LCNRFFEKSAKIFLNGAFGAEFWALRAQNLAPPTAKILGGQVHYYGANIGGGLPPPQYWPHTSEPVLPIFCRLGARFDGPKIQRVLRAKMGAEGAV